MRLNCCQSFFVWYLISYIFLFDFLNHWADVKTHPKSIAMNAATLATLSFSVFSYSHPQYKLHLSIVVILSIFIAYMVPPRGWMRPQPSGNEEVKADWSSTMNKIDLGLPNKFITTKNIFQLHLCEMRLHINMTMWRR